MVEFVTLFLGLISGLHQVEVMVDNRVAAVELRLDGETVTTIEDEPWRTIVDFGPGLESRKLVAVALDRSGTEIGRVSQALNRPRPQAEAHLLIERDAAGKAIAARLEWQSSAASEPISTEVSFDGKPLEVESPSRFELPDYDTDRFHVLQADLYFDLGVSAHAQATLGGLYVDETSGALSALLVRPTGARRLPKAELLSQTFSVDGRTLPLVAIEKGSAEVIFVRADGTSPLVGRLEGKPFTGAGRVPMAGRSVAATDNSDRLRATLSLPSSHRMRLLLPHAKEETLGHLTFDAFIVSPALSARSGGVYWLLSQGVVAAGAAPEARLTDAVAVAGLQVARGNRRRAVVLVTREGAPDSSKLSPETVRSFLSDLDVPLHVWHIGGGEPAGGWPPASRVDAFAELRKAVRALEKDLESQRVVWLAGHLSPSSVVVAPGAELVRIGQTPAGD